MIHGLRFCTVKPEDEARERALFLGPAGWGLSERDMGGGEAGSFPGAVFPTGDGSSWAEIWAEGEGIPACTMLHIVVDDADAYAEKAKSNGVAVQGPMDAHGERIYFAEGPGGLQVAVLSKREEETG